MGKLVSGAAETPPAAPVLETDVTGIQEVATATAPGNKLRTLFGTKLLKVLASIRVLGYGIDDQADPAVHPFFDSEGSQKVRPGGRSYKRDKKYTAGAAINGTVDFEPKAGSPIEIESIFFLIGGAKATVDDGQILRVNSADAILGYLAADAAIAAGQFLEIPAPGTSPFSNDNAMESTGKVLIHNPDKLRILLNTMANTEIFTVRARLLVHGPDDPDISLATNLTEADE